MCCYRCLNLPMLFASACLLLLPAFANAHPFHASTTEIEWNSASRRFEIAMKLRIVDLEDAISLQQGSRFRLEHSAGLKPLLQKYLQQHFAILFADHAVSELTWIGHELELHDVWIYFEARSVQATQGAGLTAADLATVGQLSGSANVTDTKDSPVAIRPERKLTWDELLATDRSTKKSDPQRVRIRSSMLVDVQPEQVNLVVLTFNQQVLSATLNAEQPETVLEVP